MKKNKNPSLADLLKKQLPGWKLVTTNNEPTNFLKVREIFQIAPNDGGPVRVAEINNGIINIISG